MITREQIRRYIFIWVLLFVVVFLLFIYLLWQNFRPVKDKKEEILPQPTYYLPTKRIFPTRFITDKIFPSPHDVIPTDGTGALIEEDTPEEINKVNQAFELRKLLPLKTAQFELSYDYLKYVFVVLLKEPFAENKIFFTNWREENGFSDIAEEKFVYKSY